MIRRADRIAPETKRSWETTMSNEGLLDEPSALRSLDPQRMLEILRGFPEQIVESLASTRSFQWTPPPGVRRILACGMGGSAIGADLAFAFLGPRMSIPFSIVRDYNLPGGAGPETLVFVCSYSGNTGEALACWSEAMQRNCPVVAISSGGDLSEEANRLDVPLASLPAGLPPRTAYMHPCLLILRCLQDLGIGSGSLKAIERAIPSFQTGIERSSPETPLQDNPAKRLAVALQHRIPMVYSSERLGSTGKRWADQFCENSKQLAFACPLPEAVHNQIAGWKHPAPQIGAFQPLILRDREDDARLQSQMDALAQGFSDLGIAAIDCWTEGDGWEERLWSLILLGDYCSVYLGLLNREDPVEIAAIDRLKEAISQTNG